MDGWHHQLVGHEFEHALGYGDGQGSLACCSPWGLKESGTTEQLNNDNILFKTLFPFGLLQGIEQSSLCYTIGSVGYPF